MNKLFVTIGLFAMAIITASASTINMANAQQLPPIEGIPTIPETQCPSIPELEELVGQAFDAAGETPELADVQKLVQAVLSSGLCGDVESIQQLVEDFASQPSQEESDPVTIEEENGAPMLLPL